MLSKSIALSENSFSFPMSLSLIADVGRGVADCSSLFSLIGLRTESHARTSCCRCILCSVGATCNSSSLKLTSCFGASRSSIRSSMFSIKSLNSSMTKSSSSSLSSFAIYLNCRFLLITREMLSDWLKSLKPSSAPSRVRSKLSRLMCC